MWFEMDGDMVRDEMNVMVGQGFEREEGQVHG